MNTAQVMFFLVNPNSKVGKRILRMRLAFIMSYGMAKSEESYRLSKESGEMYQRAKALYDVARLARETGKPFRFLWLHLCGKLVFYRGDWSLGRAKKYEARGRRLYEKAEALRELLGYGNK
jgi:hypothetical protein